MVQILVGKRNKKQVAQLWQRLCEIGDFKGRVNLRLNFWLNGHVSCHYLQIIRWGNGYTTILLLEKFTQRNFVADIIRFKLSYIF